MPEAQNLRAATNQARRRKQRKFTTLHERSRAERAARHISQVNEPRASLPRELANQKWRHKAAQAPQNRGRKPLTSSPRALQCADGKVKGPR